jgi:hypothetical protein
LSGDKVREADKVSVVGFVVLVETKTPELVTKELVASAVRGALSLAEIVGAHGVVKEVEAMGEIQFGE